MGKTPQGSLPWLSKCWQPQSPLPQTRRFYFCGRTHRPNSMVNDFFQLLSSQLVKVLQVEVKLAPQFLEQDSLLLHHLAGGQLSRTPRLKAKETGSTRAFCCRSLLCSIILHALADSMHSCCMWLNDLPAFYSVFFKISSEVMYLQRSLVVKWLEPCETAAISPHSVYSTQPCTMSCHFMQSHIHRVRECFPVTCHLHFWQNDLDLLHSVAVE